MRDFLKDVRYGLRMLAKAPGFTAVAVLTLALGTGANNVMFSVANAVLLRPLPYPEPERLQQLVRQYPQGSGDATSGTKVVFWHEHNRTFEEIAAYDFVGSGSNLTDGGEPERVQSFRVTPGFFRTLGVGVALGRDFAPADGEPNGEAVCILSDGLWRRRYGAKPSLVGEKLRINGEAHTVIGIAPRGFTFTRPADLWTPLRITPSANDRPNLFLTLGRLKRGVSLDQAREDLASVAQQFRTTYPNLMDTGESLSIRSYHEVLVGSVRTPLLVLLGAVGLVLLIACGNVANLLLARGSTRRQEIVLRAALGAKGSRIFRQLLTESLLLALAGLLLGLAVTPWSLELLTSLTPDGLNPLQEISLDGNVLVFSLAITVLTGLLFGLLPAFQATHVNLQEVLKEGSARGSQGTTKGRLRAGLVVGQMALSVVLVIGSALLMTTFVRLGNVDPGFKASGVLTMDVSVPAARYRSTEGMTRFTREVLQKLDALPGVELTAAAFSLPLQLGPDLPFEIAGRSGDAEQSSGETSYRPVTAKYLEAMQIPIRKGRAIENTDSTGSEPVVVINEALERRWFAGKNPIGEHITLGVGMGPVFADAPRRIVGVVGDVHEVGLDRDPPPTVFVPYAQLSDRMTELCNQLSPRRFVLRTSVEPLSLQSAVRRAVRTVDPEVAASEFRTVEQIVSSSVDRQRFNMVLAGVFAALALFLAAIGLYGVLAFSVTQRTRELGIRMALGASRGETLRMVLQQGMTLAVAGLVVGVAAALVLTRLLNSMLFGIAPNDPVTFAIVVSLLALVAAAACAIPARRATQVDPMTALRHE